MVDEIRKAKGGRAVANGARACPTSPPSRAHGLEQADLDTFGRLDVVVNNAGFLRDRMFVSNFRAQKNGTP